MDKMCIRKEEKSLQREGNSKLRKQLEEEVDIK